MRLSLPLTLCLRAGVPSWSARLVRLDALGHRFAGQADVAALSKGLDGR